MENTQKVCSRCDETRAAEEYNRHGDGLQPWCRPCRRDYYEEHRYAAVAARHNWKARQLGIHGTLTAEDIAAVYAEQGSACLCCERVDDLTIDHVQPYALRGLNERDNLQVLCRRCNSRKGPYWCDYR
jgi:5-methylcytosine-specific restriction endonuclease McrA